MAKIVSIQRTPEGIVVCLLLPPNETSPELRTFARPRRRSKIPPQLETSTKQLIVSNVGPVSPPPDSPDEPERGTGLRRLDDRGRGPRGILRREL